MQRENGTHEDGFTRRLAGFIANLRYDDIPPEVIERAKLLILDSLGCALYAAQKPPSQPNRDVVLGVSNPEAFEHRKSSERNNQQCMRHGR